MFVNPEIPLDALPDAEDVDWHALHPRFVRCRQAKKLIRLTVLVVVAAIAHTVIANVPKLAAVDWLFPSAWIFVAAWVAWSLTWPVIESPRRGYAVRDKDILYKAGVLWRAVTVVPYNRVQHAETGSSPLDRHFGLARLTVFTAGTTGGDLRIDGLGEDIAERLRVYIVGKLGGTGEMPGPATETTDEGVGDLEHA